MGWAVLPYAFVLGVVVGAFSVALAIRTAGSARAARPPQRQPALRVVIGGRR